MSKNYMNMLKAGFGYSEHFIDKICLFNYKGLQIVIASLLASSKINKQNQHLHYGD